MTAQIALWFGIGRHLKILFPMCPIQTMRTNHSYATLYCLRAITRKVVHFNCFGRRSASFIGLEQDEVQLHATRKEIWHFRRSMVDSGKDPNK